MGKRQMLPRQEDPAERDNILRFYYRGRRPTLLGRCSNRVWAWAAGFGLLPDYLVTLLVMDPQSHRLRPPVLVTATYQGRRYLVSMLGEGSNWVRDARETGAAFIKRGHKNPITLTEIPPGERAPILKAWCQIATSGRKHLPVAYDAPTTAFEAIAADYPVFRIDPR
jgi:hypothetical protein